VLKKKNRDIDDTIKHTNVLGGLKSVFKNVFLAGLDQVAIEGMAKWYQDLQALGCWMHYISNSPLELWYCIEGFLAANGFPRGDYLDH
jgi:phosphatidate phosphatase APP1